MSLLQIHPSERDTFGDGLEEASRLVAYFEVRDPVMLRAAAATLEARGTTSYEFGLAAGLRLIAEDVEDFPRLELVR